MHRYVRRARNPSRCQSYRPKRHRPVGGPARSPGAGAAEAPALRLHDWLSGTLTLGPALFSGDVYTSLRTLPALAET